MYSLWMEDVTEQAWGDIGFGPGIVTVGKLVSYFFAIAFVALPANTVQNWFN